MSKTSTDLVTNVRRRAQLSQDNGQSLSDADILALASDELQNVVAPRIYAMRGWHYASKKQYTLGSQRYYRIPDRAAGGTIISVEIVNSTPPNRQVNLAHPLQMSLQNAQLTGESYYIYNNNIVLSSGCPSSGTMIVRFLIAPGTITGTALEGVGGSSSNSITFTTAYSVLNATGQYDIYRTTSPYEVIVSGAPGHTAGGGLTVIFSPALLGTQSDLDNYSTIDGLTVADLQDMVSSDVVGVTNAGECYRPQLYDEHYDYLAQRTAMRCMEAIGHTEDLENMSKKLMDLERAFNQSIAPRERGDIKAILQEDFYYDRRF